MQSHQIKEIITPMLSQTGSEGVAAFTFFWLSSEANHLCFASRTTPGIIFYFRCIDTAYNQSPANTLRVPPSVPRTAPRHAALLDYKQQQGQSEMSSFGFVFVCLFCFFGVWPWQKQSLGNQITESPFHRDEKPQATQTVPHRLLTMQTPPFRLLICLDLLQNRRGHVPRLLCSLD